MYEEVKWLRKYELVSILDPDLDEEELEQNIQRVEELIKSLGCEFKELNKMGARKLGFDINGKKRGFYVIFSFEAEPSIISSLEREVKLSGLVMRSMTSRS